MIKLIAFIDGSNYSKSVCDHSAWIAGRIEASVDLIHILGRRDESSTPVDLSGSIGLGGYGCLCILLYPCSFYHDSASFRLLSYQEPITDPEPFIPEKHHNQSQHEIRRRQPQQSHHGQSVV